LGDLLGVWFGKWSLRKLSVIPHVVGVPKWFSVPPISGTQWRQCIVRVTSLANLADQDRLLAGWIQRATYLQSRDTSEEILAALADHTHGRLKLPREFAKQNGVRLKRS